MSSTSFEEKPGQENGFDLLPHTLLCTDQIYTSHSSATYASFKEVRRELTNF